MSLDAIEAIKQLKYNYIWALDNHDWEAYGDCFTEDATSSFGSEAADDDLSFKGRDAIVQGIARAMDIPLKVSMHQVHHPQIELIDDSHANGRWYLQDLVFCEEQKWILNGTAFYIDEYTNIDGRWLISHTGYERVFEYVSELPAGFRLMSMSAKLREAAARSTS